MDDCFGQRSLMSTLAACGDVNRNTTCSPNPLATEVHEEVQTIVDAIDAYLKPQTKAYSEIWLDGKKIASQEPRSEGMGGDDVEPLYGKTDLPKILYAGGTATK